jgi:hypothetical protein
MDDIFVAILIVLLIVISILVVVMYFALTYLAYKYKHERKVITTGNFKVTLSKKDWDAGMASEAFAVAIKDQASGAVMLTVMITKEQDKASL